MYCPLGGAALSSCATGAWCRLSAILPVLFELAIMVVVGRKFMSEGDRNFDGIAERFANKIYGGLKGQIRLDVLWRDISENLADFFAQPKTVLDVGAGLGQLAARLAQAGHSVAVNDISGEMLTLARQTAEKIGIRDAMPGTIALYSNCHNAVAAI